MSRRWMQYPHREGTVSRQAHADFPDEAPYEREAGRSGFFGPTAHFHHRRPPTSWTRWEGELRPRAYDLTALPVGDQSPWSAPALLAPSSSTPASAWASGGAASFGGEEPQLAVQLADRLH